MTLVVLLYVPFALGIASIGPFLLRYFVGMGFVSASLPLDLLLLITAASIPYVILVSLASGIRRPVLLLQASALALIANIGLSIVLVPPRGMIGAAIGNSAMYWVALLVLFFGLRGTNLVHLDIRSVSRIWAASLAMFGVVAGPLVVLGYAPTHVALFVVLGAVVLLVSLRLLRAVPHDVASALVRYLPRWAIAARPAICWIAACRDCAHNAEPEGLPRRSTP